MASHHPIRKTVLPEPVTIPDKLYFRIGDVARLCEVPPYVLRFWETEFPQLKPNKGGTGQRLYRKRDVETALRIKSLLYDQGYTIPGARQVFKSETKEKEAAPEASSSPVAALPVEASPAVDVGAAIRQDAHRRDQLAALRDELRSLAALLNQPASPDQATGGVSALPAPVKSKPMRPHLVLEPKQPAKPDPRLLNQGDLFPAE